MRKNKRGKPGSKVAVFSILKGEGKVFTVVVDDTKSIIACKIAPDSIVYTDSYRSYNALDISYFYHR